MTTPDESRDAALVDRVWVGYHPRAMMPAIALVAVASLAVWSGRWYWDDISVLTDRAGAWVVFALAWGVWPALVGVFLYRTITLTYRLTDRAVLVDFGMLYRPVPAIPVAEITTVVVGGWWLMRWLGVGWVEVRTATRLVRLAGVRHPQVFAEKLRAAITVAG